MGLVQLHRTKVQLEKGHHHLAADLDGGLMRVWAALQLQGFPVMKCSQPQSGWRHGDLACRAAP